MNGPIYATVSRGRFVVKLPRAPTDTLIASGTGLPFDAGKGRPMKEWVAIAEHAADQRTKLADKARRFVSSASDQTGRACSPGFCQSRVNEGG